MTAISYRLDNRYFPTQTALEQEVKAHLRSAPRDRVFTDSLFREVVNNLHEDCVNYHQYSTGEFELLSWRKQSRLKMKTAEYCRGNDLLVTRFVPLNEWRDVTVFPWKRKAPLSAMIAALRVLSHDYIPVPTNNDKCAINGCQVRGYGLNYHHIDPVFADMASECMTLFTRDEINTSFGYRKFAVPFREVWELIPDTHPAIIKLKEFHQNNKWSWLCQAHHREL